MTNIRPSTIALVLAVAGMVLPGAAAAAPVVAESVEIHRASGKVSVISPDGRRRSIGSRADIRVGSIVDARKGRVVVTAAFAGGETRSAEAAGARFRVTQARGPTFATTLTVEAPSRRACERARTSVVPTSGPLKVRVPPRRRRYGRASTTATDGTFVTAGRFGSGTNQGDAQWETTEGCEASTVASSAGRVSGKLLTFEAEEVILKPGYMWIVACAAGQPPVTRRYCQTFLGQEFEGRNVLFGAGLYARSAEDRYEMCVTGPTKVTECRTWAFSAPATDGERSGIVVCAAPQAGRYSVTWRLRGIDLGLRLPAYTARRGSRNTGPCSGGFGAETFPPGDSKLPLRPDSMSVNQYTLPTAASISSLDLAVSPANVPGTAYLTGVIYADDNGAPGARLGASQRLTVTRNDPEGLKSMDFRPSVDVPAGAYWFGVLTQGTRNLIFYRYEPGAALAIGPALVPGVANDPFGPLTIEDRRMSMDGRYQQPQ